MSYRTTHLIALAALALSVLAVPALAAPVEDQSQAATSDPNRALRGRFSAPGGIFHCINTSPGGFDENLELVADGKFEMTATKVEFTFDGRGGFTYVNDQNLALNATDVLAGQDPIGTVGGATVYGTGSYSMEPDRRNFTFEYTIFIDFGESVGQITSTPLRGNGFLSRDRRTVSLGITEAQLRSLYFNGGDFIDQVCTWSVTALR